MARPKVAPELRRSTTVSAALSPKLRYQAELAAQIEGKSLAAFVEAAIQAALHRVKLPHPTGIPLEMQKEIDLPFRSDLEEMRSAALLGQEKTTSVADEVILWNEDPAVRFFLRGYLAPDTLPSLAQAAWKAIKEKTVVESVMPYKGLTFRSSEWPPIRVQEYIRANWKQLQQILQGELSPDALPDRKSVRTYKKAASPLGPPIKND
jgi:hypothetical protein